MTPDMPDEIRSWRDIILLKSDYEDLVELWREYINKHPDSAVAHVQLARALRYARLESPEERTRLIGKAYELDPNCPEALLAVADETSGVADAEGAWTELEKAHGHGLRAVALAPTWPDPHFTLWSLCIAMGRWEEAREHLRAILRKDGYPPAVIDFGHNLLVSAEPDAIILTNGDNDTYPPLAIQEVHGIRPDVALVNLSLLNRVGYAAGVWRQTFGDGQPFSESQIRDLHASWKANPDGEIFSTRVMQALVGKVAEGTWTRPVYFASTVTPYHLDRCDADLEIEGLLFRVTRDAKRDVDSEPRLNLERTLQLFANSFRLDSATDLSSSWPEHSAAARLMRNYAAVLQYAAGAAAEEGRLEDVRHAMAEAIRLMEFHGEREMVKQMDEYMKKLESGGPD